MPPQVDDIDQMSSPDPAISSSVPTTLQFKDGDMLRRRNLSSRSNDEMPSRPPLRFPRRASSVMTDSSVDRMSMSSDFLNPRANVSGEEEELHEDPSLWQSVPLLLAIVPAIGGIFFKKGSVLLTDLTLMLLAGVYLNWCLVTPWTWYHNAQTVKVTSNPFTGNLLDSNSTAPDEAIVEEDDEDHDDEKVPQPTSEEEAEQTRGGEAALKELQLHEVSALAMCFIGPLLGAYMLHMLRSQISSFGDELVGNMHLTLFVLGAEIRPARYAVKMVQARTLYLQRLVRQDPHALQVKDMSDSGVDELRTRLDEMQASIAESQQKTSNLPAKGVSMTDDAIKKHHSALQGQVDALTRAVRRYEKRATAQTIQTEARLHDLELRLRDALSLAAVAASNSQRSIIASSVEKLSKLIITPALAAWAVVVYPFRLAMVTLKKTLFRLGLLQPVRRSNKQPTSRPSNNATAKGKAKK